MVMLYGGEGLNPKKLIIQNIKLLLPADNTGVYRDKKALQDI